MKRLHVSLSVADLDASIGFYSTVFGAPPTVCKDDYAKWMLDDPRVNFSIVPAKQKAGFNHLGIQVEDAEELDEVHRRMTAAERPMRELAETTCCYARSTKAWIADPDGVLWEAFLTTDAATVYGDDESLDDLVAAEGACCGGDSPRRQP